MPNRLASETSPYLLQHKDNPVDWYPWGEEAFALAAELDRPVFLSIGYSSCHWCHVMEHESFEDPEVADLLNSEFISVKVDREEHPDVDDAYMNAIQMMSSRGGWPASLFLTPNRAPFYGGTYFPKDDRQGHAGFVTVCRHIANVWKTKRTEIDSAAREISDALSRTFATEAPAPTQALGPETFERALLQLAHEFDSAHGGFGGAPKFPPHTSLEFLTTYAMSPICGEQQVELGLGMALTTLVRMCMGGIRDHVGGGFHRYSTDSQWLLPHFEKMLYDNALMLASLVRGAIVAGEIDPPTAAFLQRAADEIVAWLMTEMRSPEGAFYSAIDADSDREEGKYYVWSEGEIRDLLGVRSGDFIRAFDIHPHGNFADEATGEHTGANVLHLSAEEYGAEFQQDLTILRQARAARTRPATDIKCLVGWNGLAIDALAIAGHLVPAAEAALAILEAESAHGRLPRHVTNGRPAGEAFLEDYAYFASGLVKLSGLTGVLETEKISIGPIPPSTFWTEQALRLIQEMIEKFYDSAKGGFFAISDRHQMLFGATKPVFDQPAPSANAIAIRCLVEIGDDERASQSLTAMLGWMERAPQATEALYATALAMLPGELKGESSKQSSPKQSSLEEPAPEKQMSAPAAKVAVRLSQREIVADKAGWATGEVTIAIPAGLHINSPEPIARWIVPTRLKIRPLESKIQYPPVSEESYIGNVAIPFQVELPSGSRGEEFEIEVSFQACTDSECHQPESVTLSGVAVRA